MDLGTIVKESMKRITSWSAKYYTRDKSYYPVPQSSMPLSAVASMSPLPSETISKKNEAAMREWLDNYRPVRQRTVRSETTKGKAGALPLAVYSKTSNTTTSAAKVRFVEEIDRSTPIDHESEEERDSPNVMRQCSVEIAFVNEENVTVAVGDSVHIENGQIDKYDSDSDDKDDSACGNDFSEVLVSRA